ncbi:Acyl-CoA synthetase (AMP-forming)/AMP-acid ligase II [Nonomuraea pusilla]|uniref:Acyl-CoA synthetase (AMP-forming)/AMP-acid ligase II n=2 Tax=Nonomuraea pusilla TaxID=46177 RepID=A0A1H8CCW8_9ACTN|nr:Acyl-CoA synthetase (AMP-forming)/AMP-acid ligase II [Nonomuraea pusilla]
MKKGTSPMSATDHGPPLDPTRVAGFLARSADLDGSTSQEGIDGTLDDLAKLKLEPGDAVIVALSNSMRTVCTYLATLLLGLVPIAVSPRTPPARIRRLADTLGARALLAARPDPYRYGTTGSRPVGGAEAVLLGGTPTGGQAGDVPPYRAGQVLMSTSGTSGALSACLHRADALLRNARRHAAAVRMTADDVVLVNLPLYYSYAMVAQVLAAYVTGARIVVTGPPFTPAGYTSAIAAHGITHSSITPELARRLLAHGDLPQRAPRVMTVGGDQIHPAQVARLLAARPDGELYLTYGLTEAGPRVLTLAAHAEPAHRHASAGLPLPGVRTSLRPETGELLVESDTVLERKIGGPAPERTLIAPGRIATGDVFAIDEDGYHYFRGRRSDFAIVRGEKVHLGGLRQTVNAIPGVVRCTPRLAQDPAGESVLELEITVTDPRPDTEARLRSELDSLLMPAERPRAIRIAAADPEDFHK